MSVPTPGTDERHVYDEARAHVLKHDALMDVAAMLYLTGLVQRGASDAVIAAAVRGSLAGIGDWMTPAIVPVATVSPACTACDPDRNYDQQCQCECACHVKSPS